MSSSFKTAIVIPARYGSTRYPGKPLLDETGWPLIRHVYEQAKKARLAQQVVIATDDDRIAKAVESFGGTYVMTGDHHPTGTDRLAEVAEKYLPDVDLIVNVQGDEPELEPEKIDALIELYRAAGDAAMATLVCPFPMDKLSGSGSPSDPAACKAVLGKPVLRKNSETSTVIGYETLYFSRSPIPFPRDANGVITDPSQYFMHIGIYAYSPEFLRSYVTLPQGRLEKIEKLEQLRVLENGWKIVAGVVDAATPGVDTAEDYQAFLQRFRQKQENA